MVTKKRGRPKKQTVEEPVWNEEEHRENFRGRIKKALTTIVGILILVGGIYICVWQWEDLWPLIQGVTGPVLILIALFVLLLASLE